MKSKAGMGMRGTLPMLPSSSATLILALQWAAICFGDVYMHNPRGSNNKLIEQNDNTQDQSRLFNSQNNAAGGYQVGDACIPHCQVDNNNNNYDNTKLGAGAGTLYFYEYSTMYIEWTAQHACGFPNSECTIVLQYMCDDGSPGTQGIRNGNTGYNTNTLATILEDPNNPLFGSDKHGQHETYAYWRKCRNRERNRGLWNSDSNVQNNKGADATRQNANGDRRGYECQEERDYYPYWHPTPWKDIAVLTTNKERCKFIRRNSQNVADKYECLGVNLTYVNRNNNNQANNPILAANNENACRLQNGQWTRTPSWDLRPPACLEAPFQRDNHLGNGIFGVPSNYNWTIPKNTASNACVLRLRYNISTTDYKGGTNWAVDSVLNGQDSPIKNNPSRDFLNNAAMRDQGASIYPEARLTLAMNTAQFGRVFQDRSHVFRIVKHSELGPKNKGRWRNSAASPTTLDRLVNVNVRGRRGNIVQVYPAVEYDFVPTNLKLWRGDYVHLQWVGSDANQNNDGQGRRQTDRSNIVQVGNQGANFPLTYDKNKMFTDRAGTPDVEKISFFAYLNQDGCQETTDTNSEVNCYLLNRAPASIDGGVIRINTPGKISFVSTRNNNFSNRSQKGLWIVPFGLSIGALVGVALGCVAFLLIIFMVFATCLWVKSNTHVAFVKKPWVRKVFCIKQIDEEFVPYDKTSGIFSNFNNNFFIAFSTINFLLFLWGFLGYTDYIIYHGNVLIPIAKSGGLPLNFNCAIILLPMCRNLLSFVRTTPLGHFLNLDFNILFHKTVAGFIVFFTLIHIIAHAVDVVWFHTHNCSVGCLPGFWGWSYGDIFLSPAVSTGIAITLMMGAMMITGLDKIKRHPKKVAGWKKKFCGFPAFGMFDMFWYTHHLWIFCYLLLWIHAPNFYSWSWLIIVLFMMEKSIEYLRLRQPVNLKSVVLERDGVIRLVMTKEGFVYESGMYLRLKCNDISMFETHPFTISSAPEEDSITVHIRTGRDMDWTTKLKSLMNFPEDADKRAPVEINFEQNRNLIPPHIAIDGPYGAASQEYTRYKVCVLVAAGIGVTPFASILKSFALRKQFQSRGFTQGAGTQPLPDKIYFYWIVNVEADFEWFSTLMNSVKQSDWGDAVSFNTYCSGTLNLIRYESTKGKRPWDINFTGKPRWDGVLADLKKNHAGANGSQSQIGIFLCGPPDIGVAIKSSAKRFSDSTCKFHLLKENF